MGETEESEIKENQTPLNLNKISKKGTSNFYGADSVTPPTPQLPVTPAPVKTTTSKKLVVPNVETPKTKKVETPKKTPKVETPKKVDTPKKAEAVKSKVDTPTVIKKSPKPSPKSVKKVTPISTKKASPKTLKK